jgi:hypothetical protein
VIYPGNLPTGVLLSDDFFIRRGLSLLKSKIDSVYIHYYGFPAYPWTYTELEKVDHRAMGTDIMEVRKAIDYAVPGYYEHVPRYTQKCSGAALNTGLGPPWTDPPTPSPLPYGTVVGDVYNCYVGSSLGYSVGKTIETCKSYAHEDIYRSRHDQVTPLGTYYSLSGNALFHFWELESVGYFPPGSELTESLLRFTAKPIIPGSTWPATMTFKVYLIGDPDTKTCEVPPPSCADSLWPLAGTEWGSFTVKKTDIAAKNYDVPISWTALDPRTLLPRKIIGLAEEHIFGKTGFDKDIHLTLLPSLRVYFSTLILKGF